MKENWQKENLEKTKEVLNEHFSQREQEAMTKEMIRIRPKKIIIMPFNTLHFEEKLNIDELEIKDYYEDLIWNAPIERKSIFNKIKDILSSFYWGLRYNLWFFLFKTQIIKIKRKRVNKWMKKT